MGARSRKIKAHSLLPTFLLYFLRMTASMNRRFQNLATRVDVSKSYALRVFSSVLTKRNMGQNFTFLALFRLLEFSDAPIFTHIESSFKNYKENRKLTSR